MNENKCFSISLILLGFLHSHTQDTFLTSLSFLHCDSTIKPISKL